MVAHRKLCSCSLLRFSTWNYFNGSFFQQVDFSDFSGSSKNSPTLLIEFHNTSPHTNDFPSLCRYVLGFNGIFVAGSLPKPLHGGWSGRHEVCGGSGVRVRAATDN